MKNYKFFLMSFISVMYAGGILYSQNVFFRDYENPQMYTSNMDSIDIVSVWKTTERSLGSHDTLSSICGNDSLWFSAYITNKEAFVSSDAVKLLAIDSAFVFLRDSAFLERKRYFIIKTINNPSFEPEPK